MNNCTNCGSQVPDSMAFCGSCGTATAAPAQEPITIPEAEPVAAGHIAAVASTPAAAPAVAPPPMPGMPGANGGPGAAAMPGAPVPPVTAPPAAGGGKSKGRGKLIGMGVTGLVAVVAILKLFTGGPEPVQADPQLPDTPAVPAPDAPPGGQDVPAPQPPPGPDVPAPQPPPGPEVPAPQPPPDPAPDGGGLQAIIPQTVGEFQMAEGSQFPDLIQEGATDAYYLVYQAADGRQVTHVVAAYADANGAATKQQMMVQQWQQELGMEVHEDAPLVIDGQTVGRITVLVGQDARVVWSNGVLWGVTAGAGNDAIDFFNQLPY